MKRIVAKNDQLQLVIVPELEGKLASLIRSSSGREFRRAAKTLDRRSGRIRRKVPQEGRRRKSHEGGPHVGVGTSSNDPFVTTLVLGREKGCKRVLIRRASLKLRRRGFAESSALTEDVRKLIAPWHKMLFVHAYVSKRTARGPKCVSELVVAQRDKEQGNKLSSVAGGLLVWLLLAMREPLHTRSAMHQRSDKHIESTQ